jgi:hypothetical protein
VTRTGAAYSATSIKRVFSRSRSRQAGFEISNRPSSQDRNNPAVQPDWSFDACKYYRGGAEQNTMTVVMMPSEFVSIARAFGDMKPREIKKD